MSFNGWFSFVWSWIWLKRIGRFIGLDVSEWSRLKCAIKTCCTYIRLLDCMENLVFTVNFIVNKMQAWKEEIRSIKFLCESPGHRQTRFLVQERCALRTVQTVFGCATNGVPDECERSSQVRAGRSTYFRRSASRPGKLGQRRPRMRIDSVSCVSRGVGGRLNGSLSKAGTNGSDIRGVALPVAPYRCRRGGICENGEAEWTCHSR